MKRVILKLTAANRSYSTNTLKKPKPVVTLDTKVTDELTNEVYKPRQHPGTDRSGVIALPSWTVSAILKSVKDHSVKVLYRDSQVLSRYLKGRHMPPEENQIKYKRQLIADKLIQKIDIKDEEQFKKFENKVEKLLKSQVYQWQPVVYDNNKSLQYLIGRSPQEYSIILRIFNEIKKRDPDFQPRSYFDFGSGVGSGLWAAAELWKDSIFEYFMVDVSREMNDLAELILQGGEENKGKQLKNVNFRQFLPAADVAFDVVVSAYSLFELPDTQSRLEAVLNLWNKCDRYLVIVEQGTMAGFKVINEARDFILHLNNKDKSESIGHVFAPCPHNMTCPRLLDKTPCNFVSSYRPLPIGIDQAQQKEMYSYVVLKKGPINDNNTWPRIVRPTLVRSKHAICRMCTKDGTLDEVIFSQAKHGKFSYRCAKSSDWGDRLPIDIQKNADSDI
ncbi:Methyltransferase-like protein 17, mitochondrial [Pseudolycoriella hygida]|uniref:Methyltransferase-like protein 17, mitochondrial n=1 Tax=Pseudolycoriella hygida TaxID=35572 RepID=A0A9Q0S4B5_9DIPT|nr:Methyltransferase-like protein 17, mitochondrial [Pseudolycoriella hygida]